MINVMFLINVTRSIIISSKSIRPEIVRADHLHLYHLLQGIIKLKRAVSMRTNKARLIWSNS
jgi:hypothetical protein